MSLKEFDYKQFLLEKGERVGLGVAVTLMVLMLLKSLFMPGGGFFSGSPSTKAKELNSATDQLDNALHTKQPGPSDLPEKGEGRLIAFDTRFLQPDNYATSAFFEPRIKENPARRPPKIYPFDEAVGEVVALPIDTYLFDRDFQKIWVLADKEGRRSSSAGGGGVNPFAQLGKGGGSMGGMMGMGGGGNQMQQQMRQQMTMQMRNNPNAARQLAGASDTQEYEPTLISVDKWNPQERTAHQPRPLRMTIIAGSFPYRKQLEEHKRQLRLPSTDAVLREEVDEPDDKKGEKKGKAQAFRFLGVDVERMEVDADDKPITKWEKLEVGDNYQVFLNQTYIPFHPDDPKITPVRFPGLAMPLLREFHASQASAPGLPGLTQLMLRGSTAPGGGQSGNNEASTEKDKTDIAMERILGKLPKLQDTLTKLNETKPNQIAAPKFRPATLPNAFNPDVVITGGDNNPPQPPPNAAPGESGQDFIPDYALVRVVDVYNIQPGKHYRYRMRIKMANPNYKRQDVASPEYKEKADLESEWRDVPQTVSAPPELLYYVVDEKQGVTRRDMLQVPQESALWDMWNVANPGPDQVVMQFHRWVDTTQRNRKSPDDMVPVGEWAVADRVYVGRGEYVGRKVKVDLPIWIYTRNALILPVENPKDRRRGRVKTGIDVDFGTENLDNNLILLDFAGGKVFSDSPKVDDTCAQEVLLLAPDGKLIAHNSYKDKEDKERQDRRTEVLKRILEVRIGKKD